MSNEILKRIFEEKIEVFINSFESTASSIFKKNNSIFHSLEYGMYKERSTKEFLRFIFNKDIGVSDGFLITSKDNISTQCDIIIYQNNTFPIIDNGIANFYPIEIVKGIGEIKSTLSKNEFSDALIKMANNKRLFEERVGMFEKKFENFEEYNEIFSFLICNKLDFKISNVNFDKIYTGIDHKFRHNIILSLQDGIFVYELNFCDLPKKQKEHFIKINGNIESGPVIWEFAHHTAENEKYICKNKIIKSKNDNKYEHIKKFIIIIKNLSDDITKYEIDIVSYLSDKIAKIFKK